MSKTITYMVKYSERNDQTTAINTFTDSLPVIGVLEIKPPPHFRQSDQYITWFWLLYQAKLLPIQNPLRRTKYPAYSEFTHAQ